MLLETLIHKQLEDEITHSLVEEFPERKLEIVNHVTKKLEKEPPEFEKLLCEKHTRSKYPSNMRCCARVWANHRGGRCLSKKNGGDYCTKHAAILKKENTLHFGRYDEPQPEFNPTGNRIPWFDGPPFDEMNTLFLYQKASLRDLIEDCEITP
jgi:hypothetical protein